MWHTQPFDTFPVKVVLGEIERRVNLLASKAKNMQEAQIEVSQAGSRPVEVGLGKSMVPNQDKSSLILRRSYRLILLRKDNMRKAQPSYCFISYILLLRALQHNY